MYGRLLGCETCTGRGRERGADIMLMIRYASECVYGELATDGLMARMPTRRLLRGITHKLP
jgi:hypothetical protein